MTCASVFLCLSEGQARSLLKWLAIPVRSDTGGGWASEWGGVGLVRPIEVVHLVKKKKLKPVTPSHPRLWFLWIGWWRFTCITSFPSFNEAVLSPKCTHIHTHTTSRRQSCRSPEGPPRAHVRRWYASSIKTSLTEQSSRRPSLPPALPPPSIPPARPPPTRNPFILW